MAKSVYQTKTPNMKRSILLSISLFAMICIVNAQNPPNDNGQHFRKPSKDSSFRKDHPGKPENFAQGNRPPRDQFNQDFPKKGKMGMLAALHPSPEQIKQGKAINQDFHKQLAELQKNDKISLGEYKTKLAALHKDRKTKLLALLTDKQKEQIAQHKKNTEINAQVKNVAVLERMKLTLGLTEDQVAKIKAGQTSFKSKIKAIRENDSLLPEQKKEEVKNLMTQRKDFVKALLTPDQQSKADSLRKNFKGRWNMNDHNPPVK